MKTEIGMIEDICASRACNGIKRAIENVQNLKAGMAYGIKGNFQVPTL